MRVVKKGLGLYEPGTKMKCAPVVSCNVIVYGFVVGTAELIAQCPGVVSLLDAGPIF